MPPHPGSFWALVFVCLKEAVSWSKRERVFICPSSPPCERIEEEFKLPECPLPLPLEVTCVCEPAVVPQIPQGVREEDRQEEDWSWVLTLLGWVLAGGQALSIVAWRALLFLRGRCNVSSKAEGGGSWTNVETASGDESPDSWRPRSSGLSRRRDVAREIGGTSDRRREALLPEPRLRALPDDPYLSAA